ncbi:hypothetical protein [Photobacterium angustum]|uniref:hypothetical protein n=1 Tax=Photobacterium angustum TaxID=661 RepID=UPI000A4DEC6A|nr:hypothetical protein [Photobacterium angustum]
MAICICAVLTGAPIAMIQTSYSWNGVFVLLAAIAVILVLLTCTIIRVDRKRLPM